jgi:hypothetical protein
MGRKRKPVHPNDPLLYPDHPRPVSRRDFIRQGLVAGTGVTLGGGVLSLFTNPREAHAALAQDIQDLAASSGCPILPTSNPNIPVICFDLAGGANIAGSNVLVGTNGQLDGMTGSTAYSRLGLPDEMRPIGTNGPNFIDERLGLAFHSNSAMLQGILEKAPSVIGNVNGVVIPARSNNDTANNPHNPMYGFARAGGLGDITTLIGSRNSDSGGNSMAPVILNSSEYRPVKVDRPSDVSGLVDTSGLTRILGTQDVNAVMESIARISSSKMDRPSLDTLTARNAVIKDLVKCGYIDAAELADRFAGKNIDPASDPDIVGPNGIFSDGSVNVNDDEWNGRDGGEFRKTASVMKMVIDGHAAAGTVTMGGFDYHTGDRAVGERRDLRAGRCIGACLEYASKDKTGIGERPPTPVMIYVFSDGSVSSNGRIDTSVDGGGKGEWTTDNSSTAASFILVYRPNISSNQILNPAYQTTRQIGRFSDNGAVVTNSSPAANNVNLLVNTVILNYMALNNDIGNFTNIYNQIGISHGLGNFQDYVAFAPV